jgi:D-proline reductase (dithiol) PrdB
VTAPVEYIPKIEAAYAHLGYRPYRWTRNSETPPWTPLPRPLSTCRLGLVASGGIYVTGQVAFHFKDDVSFREIPRDVATADLRATHFAYDLTDARADPNVVFPIDPLRELTREGRIGSLADHAFSFMGGVYSARRVERDLAPRIVERLRAERVDAALFVPV